MEFLEVLLAFALLMVTFATIVTVIIEIIYRMINYRQRGLERMIGALFDDILWPRFVNMKTKNAVLFHKSGIAVSQTAARTAFVNKLMSRPKLTNPSILLWTPPTKKEVMSAHEFIEELADTDAAKVIKAELADINDNIDELIAALMQRFDQYGEAASHYFASRSKQAAFAISVVLAFALNINAIEVFQFLRVDTDSRQAIIAQQQPIMEQYEQAQASLAARLADPEAEPDDKEIKEKLDLLIQQNAQLKMGSMPIGLETSPLPMLYCHAVKDNPEDCDQVPDDEDGDGPTKPDRQELSVLWFFSVLLSGLLIGLGGPFWFDLVRKISGLTGVAQTARAVLRGQPASTAEPTTGKPSNTEASTAFRRALETQ